jgi:hypothetical protein
LKQADSLPIVKEDLRLEKMSASALQEKIKLRDSLISGMAKQEQLYQEIIAGYKRSDELSDRIAMLKDGTIKALRKDLRRTKTKFFIAGFVSIGIGALLVLK